MENPNFILVVFTVSPSLFLVKSKHAVLIWMSSIVVGTIWFSSGFSLPWQWVISWVFSSLKLGKNCAHIVHSTGRSLWVSMWVFRFDLWLKDLLQTGHLWGDSSMCKILCTAKVLDWQKPLPHSLHLNGFSLLWMYLEKKWNINKNT